MEFGAVFKSKNEYSEDFFVLLPCCGKREVLKWVMKEGMIARKMECCKCGSDMQLKERERKTDGFEWICKKRGKNGAHEISRSVRRGSWFERSHMSFCEILRLTSMWFGKAKQKYVRRVCGIAKETATDWYSFNREVCMVRMMSDDMCDKLGGPGKIVEIDESLFGKMKYGRGRPVNGKWVFGGVERGSSKCFFRVVPDRSKETLFPIIRDWVLPGTTIISDCWAAYKCLEDEGFQHLSVNHSLTFVDPETGAHTNAIEGTWSGIKKDLPRKHEKNNFDSYLAEYMWRRRHGHLQTDAAFKEYLQDVIKVYPPNCKA